MCIKPFPASWWSCNSSGAAWASKSTSATVMAPHTARVNTVRCCACRTCLAALNAKYSLLAISCESWWSVACCWRARNVASSMWWPCSAAGINGMVVSCLVSSNAVAARDARFVRAVDDRAICATGCCCAGWQRNGVHTNRTARMCTLFLSGKRRRSSPRRSIRTTSMLFERAAHCSAHLLHTHMHKLCTLIIP